MEDPGTTIPDDWWPSSLDAFSKEDPLNSEYVVAAEISSPWGDRSDKLIFTGLIDTDRLHKLLGQRGVIGPTISSSGPWPLSSKGHWGYEPQFWIDGGGDGESIEPLVVSWDSFGRTILCPDQGFLMTYGLMPRHGNDGLVAWDDLQNNVRDVVKVTAPSEFYFELIRPASVLVRKSYLQDYATVRNMSIVQTYFVMNATDSPDATSASIAKDFSGDFFLPQRRLSITLNGHTGDTVAQTWGFRSLFDPSIAPISEDHNYGLLDWPGVGLIDGRQGIDYGQLPMVGTDAYVSDKVLGEYEGRPDFNIHPESGSVSYGGQWSVSHTDRIGRDLIRVELKKLYEGNRPSTVRTWHKYAVAPPLQTDFPSLGLAPNIAKRAKRVVHSMTELGEVLARISTQLGVSKTGRDLVGLDRLELNYSGWWHGPTVEPITRHAPRDLTRDDFMARCADLYKVVADGLSEKILRTTLKKLGASDPELDDFRSLKLLDRLVQLAMIAENTGLNLFGNFATIEARRIAAPITTPVSVLFHLADVRNSKSHTPHNIEKSLIALGIDLQMMQSDWGKAVDITFDQTAAAIENCSAYLRTAK